MVVAGNERTALADQEVEVCAPVGLQHVINSDATRGLVRWLWSFRAPRTMSGNIARVTPNWARPVGKPSRSVMAPTDGPTSAPLAKPIALAMRSNLSSSRTDAAAWLNAITAGRKTAFRVP